ncbi:Lysosomal trafficking regulator LYST [Phytophthora cinnamomi]|uniref:Lysosomal trafficking regulator LYST n=1 Tax=Phytophthora cinnamomi TaxID=4785 RepID=UPI00355ABDCA|nr:Lysosomal trafficking regulator LYST [Phytophthora cinnamomi]
MHRRRRSSKNAQTTRFSLLLLEDGELFLDDHSACRFLEPNARTHRKTPGRIKVCTRGLFFVPQDLQLPILRFPFRCMAAEPVAECFVPPPDADAAELVVTYMTFQTKQVVEMRERGIDHPYVYKDTTDGVEAGSATDSRSSSSSSFGAEMPAKFIFTLQHVTLEAFLASIHVIYEVANLPRRMLAKAEEESLLAPVLAPRLTDKFDPSLLIDFRERLLLDAGCPAQLNNVFEPVLNWEYTNVEQVYKRRYLLQQTGLEVYLRNGESFFFSFQSSKERDAFYALMISSSQLHKGEVTSTILSKDDGILFTTSKDSSLKLSSTRDVGEFRTVSSESALSCCDVSPDESVVFVGSWDNSVYMHSPTTGLVLDKVFAHSDGISAIRVLQDRFLTSSWDSTIKLWRYTSRYIVATPIRTFVDCEESVLCLDVSRDGRFGAAGTRTGSVYLFDLSAAVLRNQVDASSLHGGGIASISFAADNKSYVCVTVQSELVQFNLRGEKLWSMEIRTAGQVRSFDSDGKYAVGGTTAGKLLFWKLHEPAGTELVFEIPQAHDAGISALSVSSSGSTIVSGAVDGSVHVWRLQKRTPLSHNQVSTTRARQTLSLHYGSIQTPAPPSPAAASTAPKKSSTSCRRANVYVPNPTAQVAEAECCLEF